MLQHTGAANATPSPACAKAVEELRHHRCTAEVARHLGQRDGGQRAQDVERSARQAEQVAAIKTAVAAVIGEVAYATLLAGACGR